MFLHTAFPFLNKYKLLTQLFKLYQIVSALLEIFTGNSLPIAFDSM